MGSGSRFKFWFCPKWWALGLGFDNFPFERVVIVMLGPVQFEIGFGRRYDEIDPTEQDY